MKRTALFAVAVALIGSAVAPQIAAQDCAAELDTVLAALHEEGFFDSNASSRTRGRAKR